MQIYGQGLYKYDIPLTAVGYRAADAVTLVLALPLLIISLLLYRRGQLRGGLLLTGVLAYFLYTYGSMAFGAAYNPLFLVYTILFSASLFALVLSLLSFDVQELPAHFGGVGACSHGLMALRPHVDVLLNLLRIVAYELTRAAEKSSYRRATAMA